MSPAPDSAGLTFRQDYFGDHAAWRALVSLLDDTFGIDIGPLEKLGGPDPACMPFGWFAEDGALVANLSAFAMPVVINGRRVNAAGLQSGAVRPPWRGRGLYRDVIRKALDWCVERGFEAVVLYTDKPALYEAYGFRTLPMHSYRGEVPAFEAARDGRRLDPLREGDLVLLQALIARREPVSNTLAVVSSPAMFLINTQLDPDVKLTFIEELSAAIAWRMPDDGHFALLDIVAPAIPPLGKVLSGLGLSPVTAEVHFRPDKLDWHCSPIPSAHEAHFMIRGLEGLELDAPAMLSPMADF